MRQNNFVGQTLKEMNQTRKKESNFGVGGWLSGCSIKSSEIFSIFTPSLYL